MTKSALPAAVALAIAAAFALAMLAPSNPREVDRAEHDFREEFKRER